MSKKEPVTFSPEIFDKICSRLGKGLSLRKVCEADDMPNASNVYVWLKNKPELQEQYARARETQADALFDDCLDIADQYDNRAENDGETDHIQRAKLRIDTRKWMAGKLRPKKYGDKLELSGDAENPVAIQTIERIVIDPKATDSNA